MKRKKNLIIALAVVGIIIMGTWFSWHCVNMILRKRVEATIAEMEEEAKKFPARSRQQAYNTGEDVLYFMNYYNGGGDPSEVAEMLKLDSDMLKTIAEDSSLEELDKTAIKAMAVTTDGLIQKVIMNDTDTSEDIEGIKDLMEYLKQQGFPEEDK